MSPFLSFQALRDDIPLLTRVVEGGRRLVYLDSAATSLTPGRVLRAMMRYYEESRANVHRGKHLLSEEASTLFEEARRQVAAFVNAAPAATVFTAGTTASINLVALGLRLRADDVVVTTSAEHHALLLPFMGRCELRMLDVGKDGKVDVERLVELVDAKTRLVALAHASNVTGAIHDVAAITCAVRARAPAARVLIDAAQSVAHLPVDVAEIGADYLVFSGHKMLGPTGVGVLCGTLDALEELSVELRGGGAVRMVTRDAFTSRSLPHKLEPGTPDIAGVIGLGEAAALLSEIGMAHVAEHGRALGARLAAAAAAIEGAVLLGPPPGAARLPLVSLAPRSSTVSADHVAMVLSDSHGVMVRSGHHCCHPFFDALGLPGAVRASAGAYTADEDIDVFAAAAGKVFPSLIRA